jgi:TolB-like protein/tetratricopeptide (TPR) repeat protein
MKTALFIAELKSRGVYRVAALYAAGAWGLLQVADVLFPVLGLPDWSITAVLLLGAIGFPFALILAWMFDLTPQGVVEASSVPAELPIPRLSLVRIFEIALILVLTLLVGYLYADRLVPQEKGARPSAATGDLSRASIAVLPFINMSGVDEVEYFGDGLAEEILNLLAQLDELDVAARTSSFYFKNKDVDLATIGHQLGVAHILEGSVRHQGNRVRVTAQLIELGTGFHLWSDTYERAMEDIFALQDEIAGKVVENLKVLLSSDSRKVLSRDVTVDPVAYDFYLRGRDYLRRPPDQDTLEAAGQMFTRAVGMSPEFASAYAGLCDSELYLFRITSRAEDYQSAERACKQALTLDGEAVPVYVALGNLYRESGQNSSSLKQFEQALALDERSVDALIGQADTLAREGQNALAEVNYQRALQLEPNYWFTYTRFGSYLFHQGRVEEAIPYLERITQLMPESESALNDLGAAHYLSGNFEQAVAAFQQSLQVAPSAVAFSNVAANLYFLGQFDEAVAMYHRAVELAPDDYELWGNLADAYSQSARGADLAAPMYRNAITLALAQLKLNPASGFAKAALGRYHAALGERDDALRYILQAVETAPSDMYVHYYVALGWASLGEASAAVDAIEQAIGHGYPLHLIAVDAGFKPLRETLRFRSLVGPGG